VRRRARAGRRAGAAGSGRRPRAGLPAVFVDRDGTLNREVEYLRAVAGLRLLPGAREGVRRLRAAGFAVVVVTNQSAVARGLADRTAVAAIHDALRARLAAGGATLDGIYVCPHHPSAGRPPLRRHCGCRKPAPGLVRRAARELGLDLARSYCVGDGPADLGLAAAAGLRAVLVLSGHGRRTARTLDPRIPVAHVAPSFRAAAEWIIDDAGRPPRRRR
jgi:D-glycero-D-manno-heptose 1,7-bisphosphate phosphatase